AGHFVDCISAIREMSPGTKIEILTPDFRGKGRMERALEILAANPPDVFNHNIETVPELYRNVRPGADYQWSLTLLQKFKQQHPSIPTKSGIMLGLGETLEQVHQTLRDLRAHDVDMVTIGQYLQPSPHHHPVLRYWTPVAHHPPRRPPGRGSRARLSRRVPPPLGAAYASTLCPAYTRRNTPAYRVDWRLLATSGTVGGSNPGTSSKRPRRPARPREAR